MPLRLGVLSVSVAAAVTGFAVINLVLDLGGGAHPIAECPAWLAVLVSWGSVISAADCNETRKCLGNQIHIAAKDTSNRLDQFEAAGLLHTLGVEVRGEHAERLAVVHDI